eukprot:3860596-Pyramimonas_sp.AAC.1
MPCQRPPQKIGPAGLSRWVTPPAPPRGASELVCRAGGESFLGSALAGGTLAVTGTGGPVQKWD